MTQIRFALEDIIKNKSYFIRFFIQITCVLVLLGVCVSQISSINKYKKKFSVFEKTSDLYIMRDMTENDVFLERLSDDGFQSKLFELYSFLAQSQKINFYSYYSDQIIAEKEDLPIQYIQYPDKSKYYPLLYVDENFWDTFGLSCFEGRKFTKQDFSFNQTQIPIILGYQYSGYYNIGDVITQESVVETGNTMKQEFIVVGILEKDAFYLDPGKTGDILYLSGTIIAPLIVNKETPYYELDSIITSSTIIVDDHSQLQTIEEKAKAMEVYDKLEFISYAEQLKNIVRENMTYVYFAIAVQGLILFFCTICIISALMNYINSHKKEFAIHILCGAKSKDLSLRIVFQILTCLLLSNVVTFIIFGLSLASLVILLTGAMLLSLIVLAPIIQIIKKPLADYLKEV